jgi:hypothetical protein
MLGRAVHVLLGRRVMQSLPALFTFILFSAATATATAQTVSVINQQSLPRLDRSGAQIVKRSLDLEPEGISRQDCLDDQKIRVQMQLSGFEANARLEAWASIQGTDCKSPSNRTGANAVCWRIDPGAGIPLQINPSIDIPVRRLLAGAGGATPGTSPSATDGDASICSDVDLTSIDLQLLYFAPGNLSSPVVSVSTLIRADTIGSPPPSFLTTDPGAGKIVLSWTRDQASATERADDVGMNVYCVPNDAQAKAPETCTTAALVPGTTPDADFASRYQCGSVLGNTASRARVDGTANGAPLDPAVSYAFAVGTVDAFGNAGPLSGVVCQTPAAASDDSQGGASCSVSAGTRGGSGSHGLAFGGIALGVVIAAVRGSRRSLAPRSRR